MALYDLDGCVFGGAVVTEAVRSGYKWRRDIDKNNIRRGTYGSEPPPEYLLTWRTSETKPYW